MAKIINTFELQIRRRAGEARFAVRVVEVGGQARTPYLATAFTEAEDVCQWAAQWVDIVRASVVLDTSQEWQPLSRVTVYNYRKELRVIWRLLDSEPEHPQRVALQLRAEKLNSQLLPEDRVTREQIETELHPQMLEDHWSPEAIAERAARFLAGVATPTSTQDSPAVEGDMMERELEKEVIQDEVDKSDR